MGKRRLDEEKELLTSRCKKRSRPKRPPTPYIVFMTKFMRAQCLNSKSDAQKAVKAGAKIWRGMSCAERQKYARKSSKKRAQYAEKMQEYRQDQLEQRPLTLKAPPRPFAAFLRDYYQNIANERGNNSQGPGKSAAFSKMSQNASRAWHNLRHDQREQYRLQFQDQYQDYRRQLDELNYREEEEDSEGESSMPQLSPQQRNNPLPPLLHGVEGGSRGKWRLTCDETPVSSPVLEPVSEKVFRRRTTAKKFVRSHTSSGRVTKKKLRFGALPPRPRRRRF